MCELTCLFFRVYTFLVLECRVTDTRKNPYMEVKRVHSDIQIFCFIFLLYFFYFVLADRVAMLPAIVDVDIF
jgi:hypothetical protein